MNEMNDMRNNRDYDNRYYDDAFYGYRENYRGNNRRNYRDDYRHDYRYDYRRNYREQDYYEELDMITEDMREQYRKLEDVADMAHNMQDKNMIMKVAQKEKENYKYLKQIADK